MQFSSLPKDKQWLLLLGSKRYAKWVEWNRPSYPQFEKMYDFWTRWGEVDLPTFDKQWAEWERERP